MAKYIVTAAMVQVKGSAVDGSAAWLYAYRGALLDLDAGDAHVKHLLDVGLIEKAADVDNDPVVQAGLDLSALPAVAVVPDKGDDKAVWEAHAVRNGLSQSDAEMASKEDLIAIFADGGLEPEPEVKPAAAKAPAKSTPAKAAPAKAAAPSKS